MPRLPYIDTKTNINHSPHVVILGAGASRAAAPIGDRSRKILPLMNDFVEVTSLSSLLEDAGISWKNQDFEGLYNDLVSDSTQTKLVADIEARVRSYFATLELPDEPNIYDCLLLSLRSTDLIATFNWDPLLVQAYRRNSKFIELPKIAFLHGNVAIGICEEHRKAGYLDEACEICSTPSQPSKLLYPVKQKNHSDDPFIKGEWNLLRSFLNRAYCVTIFGYSAPVTDVEAKSLMLDVWKENPTMTLARVSIVDIRAREDIENTWAGFFHSHHYMVQESIYNSDLFRFPRRSCEAYAMASLQNNCWKQNPYPLFKTLDELHNWLMPLIREERSGHFSGKPCPPIDMPLESS